MAQTKKLKLVATGETPAEPHKPMAKDYLDHLRKVNDVFYDQIRMADQKAAYLFTFMLAFMISSAEGRGVFKLARYQDAEVVAIIVSLALALSVTVSMVSAILVVLPRVRTTATSLFWGAWPEQRDAFIAAARAEDADYVYRELIGNIDNLAAIARSKYRFVSIAFRSLIVTVVSYVALLAIG